MVVKKIAFCESEESINHLFFACLIAHIIWTTVQYAFNIAPPANVTNMSGSWLNWVEKNIKAKIRVRICAVVWSS